MPAIEAAFPGAVRGGKVDRALLAQEIAGAPGRLKQLESIVHPMVVKAEIDFLRAQEERGAKLAVLEIPLLFETDAHTRVDVIRGGERARRGSEGARAGAARHDVRRNSKRCSSGNCPTRKSARAPTSLWTAARHWRTWSGRSIRFIDSLQGREGRVMERLRHGQAT